MDIKTAVDEFMLACEADGTSPKTYRWYQSMLKPMLQRLGEQPLSAVTASMLRAYIVELRNRDSRYQEQLQKPKQQGGLSDASINSYIRAAHRFWRWAALEYDLPNPMQKIKRPQSYKATPKVLPLSDWVKMVAVLVPTLEGYRDHAILAFLADTGCRAAGLLSLQLKDVNLERRYAYVVEKGSKRRRLRFTHYTAYTLQIWLAERPMCEHQSFFTCVAGKYFSDPLRYDGLYHLLKRIGERAGVSSPVNPHAFRHGFAKKYLENGGDLASVSRLMGHSSVAVTAHFYAIFTSDELDDRHKRFSPLAGMPAKKLHRS